MFSDSAYKHVSYLQQPNRAIICLLLNAQRLNDFTILLNKLNVNISNKHETYELSRMSARIMALAEQAEKHRAISFFVTQQTIIVMSDYSLKKENIDPSKFSDEQLRDIIFGAVYCAKAMEQLAQDEKTLRVAYDVIKHFDDIPHERTHSDFVMKQALENIS